MLVSEVDESVSQWSKESPLPLGEDPLFPILAVSLALVDHIGQTCADLLVLRVHALHHVLDDLDVLELKPFTIRF